MDGTGRKSLTEQVREALAARIAGDSLKPGDRLPSERELIAEFVTAMKQGIGLNKILGTIHAYPTYVEANKFAAGEWKRAHAPAWALALLSRLHAWRL